MDTDDPNAADDERNIELSSLEAIYPEIVLERSSSSDKKAYLDIEVNLQSPLRVSFAPLSRHGTNTSLANRDDDEQVEEFHVEAEQTAANLGQLSVSLQHLPSLRCHMTLPESYPNEQAPKIVLECDPSWLSQAQLNRLEQHANSLWEDYGHSVMLFDYLDWLSQEAERAFDVAKDAPSNVVILSRTFEAPLLDFDLQAKKRKFAAGTFDCGVCLEPKKGAVCHKMSQCGHVFCVDCLKDYYNNCITEGTVANVKCMGFGCERERLQQIPESRRKRLDLTIKPSELAEIPLDHEKIQRYVYLKQKKDLESNRNVVFCPRKWCQGAARTEKKKKDVEDSDSEPEEDTSTTTDPFGDRLAICSECAFAFCKRCLKGPWHGEHVACRPPRKANELTEEEKATEEYLSAHSARCPTCAAPVQKIMGCNHMVCQLCRTHFCYLCQAYLMEGNPYAHFNTPGQGCYQRLWVLEGGDDENAELAERIPDDMLAAEAAADEDDDSDSDSDSEDGESDDERIGNDDLAWLPLGALADLEIWEEDEFDLRPRDPPGRGARRRLAGHLARARGQGVQRGRGRGGGAARGRGGGNAALARGAANAGPVRGGGNAAPARGGGNAAAAREPENGAGERAARPDEDPQGQGDMDRAALQRFVQMALHDQEDQWDSDELDSEGDEDWVIPVRNADP